MDLEICKKREYLVVKSNELIQRSRFVLSLPEQKAIAYICSMIKPVTAINKAKKSPYILEYDFSILEFCKICGFNYNSGKNYSEIKSVLQKLRDRSMWLSQPDGSEVLVAWLSKVRTNKRSGIAHITLDEDLAPYLFDLGQKFTQYQLYNVLGMKSSFSVRMYEILKSYSYQKTKTFDLDELKTILGVDSIKSYERYPDFRRKVLEISQKEINELTDLHFYFEPIKKGRKVVKIKFRIELKTPIERYITANKVTKKLDKETCTT